MGVQKVSRRQLLSSASLVAGASLLSGCVDTVQGSPRQKEGDSFEGEKASSSSLQDDTENTWKYVQLDSAAVAADTYRLMAQGGCMYGLFAGIVAAMAAVQGEPYRSFLVHMMKYGEGGVGLWGSLCGTLNGGAAIIGLFVPQKEQRQQLIAELFSWYETTELPSYCPKEAGNSSPIPKSIACSVLCHASVGRWCATSGDEIGSPEMAERCRRLTAEVSAKTVELLNANLKEPCTFAGPSPEVKSCLSCHSEELHDTMGQMQCTACHQQLSKDHPSVPSLSPKSNPILDNSEP